MTKYTVQKGQTILDIAIQRFGTVEKMGALIGALPNPVGAQPSGLEIEVEDAADNVITRYFENKRHLASFADWYFYNFAYVQTPEAENVLTPEGSEMIFI